jgi:hypothetical protein
MADVDFYKREIDRLQERSRESQRVWIEAVGLLSNIAPNMPPGDDPLDTARRLFDRVSALKNAYNASVAECMTLERALNEIITSANIELSYNEVWVDGSDNSGEQAFSIDPLDCPSFTRFLRQRQCCGDAACYNKSSGVGCAVPDDPMPPRETPMESQ